MRRGVVQVLFLLGLVFCSGAHAEVPKWLVFAPGQPGLAVFAIEKQSYALGCLGLAEQWNAVEHRNLSPAEYAALTAPTQYPVVADVYCDARVTKFFGPPNTPGGLIFPHRDGKIYVHYVDVPEFHYAINGPTKTLTPSQEQQYIRGPDFTHSVGFTAQEHEDNSCFALVQMCQKWHYDPHGGRQNDGNPYVCGACVGIKF